MDTLDSAVRTFQAGRFAASASGFETVLQLDPASGTARLLLSHRFLAIHYIPSRKPLDESIVRPARQNIEDTLRVMPNDPGALHAQATLLLRGMQWHEARKIFEKLARLERNDAAALYGLAYVTVTEWLEDYEAVLDRVGMSHEDPGGHAGPFQSPYDLN